MEEETILAVVAMLEGLARDRDRTALALLRRGAGESPGATLQRGGRWLLPLIPQDQPPWVRESCATLAVLFALWHQGFPEARFAAPPSLGGSLRHFAAATEPARGLRLLQRLLASDRPELPGVLEGVMRQLRLVGIPVDWVRLGLDLDGWGHPANYVQQRWATDYWLASPDDRADREEVDALGIASDHPDRPEQRQSR
jgi:CRISPR type I-E-associated protein CasB/Cse2